MASKTDILDDVIRGRLTASQAGDVVDEVLESDQASELPSLLGMDEYEWTAYAHGACVADLALWREQGWPATCCICGLPLAIKEFGWTVRPFDDSDGNVRIVHLGCVVGEGSRIG